MDIDNLRHAINEWGVQDEASTSAGERGMMAMGEPVAPGPPNHAVAPSTGTEGGPW